MQKQELNHNPWPFPAGDSRGWVFPIVNGQQTAQSKVLQADKGQHKPTSLNLDDIEEALV